MLRVDRLEVRVGECLLNDLSFQVARGEYFVILGASGAGKTVLLETLAGMINPVSGTVRLDGRDITKAAMQDRHMALVYQDQALFPHLSVYRNVAYGLNANGMKRGQIRSRVHEVCSLTGLTDLLTRRPGSLSGGERQRVALARAMAVQPKCLLLDEPLSSVDTPARKSLRGLLRQLHSKGQTVVHVTHDFEEAAGLATRVAIIEDGRMAQIGTPQEVFQHPTSEFVAQFVGIRNIFPGRLSRRSENEASDFVTSDLTLAVVTDAKNGPGFLTLRSEDITLSVARPEGSAQNSFLGTVKELFPARLGVEAVVDIGVDMAALVTHNAVETLGLTEGKEVWVSFKATAGKFIED